MKKRYKPRKRRCPAPPQRSARLYIRIDPSLIGRFRILLEAHDNLGIFTVVNRFKGILLLRYSPQQRREFEEFLGSISEAIPYQRLHEAAAEKVS